MKLACSNLACPKWSLDQLIEAAVHSGYEGLEFRLWNGEILPANLDKATRQEIHARCKDAGLKICCIDTSIKIATQDADARAAQFHDGLAYLDMAVEWGAPLIRVFGGTPEGTPKAEAIKTSVEALAALAQRGQELGVKVLLETHDAFSNSATVMEVLNQVPQAGAVWDILHPYRFGEQPAQTADCLGDRCFHVHIKDGRRVGSEIGQPWDLTLLGEGEVPVPAILSILHQHGYDGWLTAEWEKKWHPEIAEPEIAIPQHAQVLREYLARLN